MLRQRHRHAQHRRVGGRRSALQPLPRHLAVLADERRRCSPAATTTPSAWASSPTSPLASRATTAASPVRRQRCRACCSDAGYSTFAVGKWHLDAAMGTERRRGRSISGPSGLGFERYYGFLAGDTNQWTPHLVQRQRLRRPAPPPRGRLSPHRGLGRPAIRLVLDQQNATPDNPSSSTSRRARCTRRTTRRASGSTTTAAHSMTDGRPSASASSPVNRPRGSCPRERDLTARPPWVQPWADLSAGRASSLRTDDGGVRRFPHAHRCPDRPCARRPARSSTCSTTRSCCSSPTTAPVPRAGRAGASTSTASCTTCSTISTRRSPRIDDLGGFRAYNHYAWGWAWAGNTPMRLWKRYSWLGGVRTPLVVHWP